MPGMIDAEPAPLQTDFDLDLKFVKLVKSVFRAQNSTVHMADPSTNPSLCRMSALVNFARALYEEERSPVVCPTTGKVPENSPMMENPRVALLR